MFSITIVSNRSSKFRWADCLYDHAKSLYLHLLESGIVSPWSVVRRKESLENVYELEHSAETRSKIAEIDNLLLEACNIYEVAAESYFFSFKSILKNFLSHQHAYNSWALALATRAKVAGKIELFASAYQKFEKVVFEQKIFLDGMRKIFFNRLLNLGKVKIVVLKFVIGR